MTRLSTQTPRFALPSLAHSRWEVLVIALLLAFSVGRDGFSQGPGRSPIRNRNAAQQTQVKVLAASGVPYGVASIEIPLRNPILGEGPGPLSVSDSQGKSLFAVSQDVRMAVSRPPSQEPLPALGQGRLLNRVGNLLRELTSDQANEPQTVARRVMFLVHAVTPFRVEVSDRRGSLGAYMIQPVTDAALHQQLLATWWQETTDAARRQIAATDTPPWVETYQVAMLSGRLGLPLPDWFGRVDDADDDPLLTTLKWIGGAADVSNRVFTSAAAGGVLESPLLDQTAANIAALPLPPAPAWQLPVVPAEVLEQAVGGDGKEQSIIEIEPLARHVPPECFYIRYGKFENFLWFKDLMEEHGGDISRMITLRGLSNNASARLEEQLAVKTNAVSRMLGPTIIADQALIGRDLFLEDGAAMGVLLQATNAFLLRTSLTSERQQLAERSDAISLNEVQFTHGTGTLLRSSDNRVRSFLVEQDGFFLVTNSQQMAARFFEINQTKESLATTPSFRLARKLMPLSREDTLFAYFSPEMLQGLLAPNYLIELRRRMQAEADVALVHLARLAANAQGQPVREIDALVEAAFLPRNFGQRADGSGVISLGEGFLDSRRGQRGTFLPIADNLVESVTAAEARWYGQIAEAYEKQFRSLDPIIVGVKREPLETPEGSDERRERLTIHAEVAPWQPESYGWWAQQLGPPTRVAMNFAPDDLVAVQAHVASDALGPPTHLFAAIKDSTPPDPEQFDGIFRGYRALKSLPGYLGAWPRPGVLDRLPLGLGRGQPVGPNLNRLLGGVYRYNNQGFSVLSFQPEVLTASQEFWLARDVEDAAQLRGRIGNLTGSQLEGWVNQQLYERASRASVSGARFLDTLHEQFSVSPEQTVDEAERILGGRPQCPLGGEYRFDSSTRRWTSTAWHGEENSVPTQGMLPSVDVPASYQAPILQWFRGVEGTVTQYENRLVADATLEVARKDVR